MDRLRRWLGGAVSPLEERLAADRYQELPYRLAQPESSDGLSPLVVFLHGAGGAGENNRSQLRRGSGFALSQLLKSPEPAYLLAPQCPASAAWWSREERPTRQAQLLLELIDELSARLAIDQQRLYLIGVSMGGHGVWDLGWRYPGRWAALVPICGAVPPTRLHFLAGTPIWCLHGELDRDVPVELSRQAVQGLKELGAPVRYTELLGVGHNCTREALEQNFLPWVFQQRRSAV